MKSSSSFATARASRTASLQRPPVCSSATQQYKRKRRRTTCCASRIFVFAAIALSHNSAQADAMRWSSDLLRLMYVCTISTTTSSALSEWKQHQSKAKLSRRDFNLLILRGGTNNGNSEANEEDYVSNELTDDREKKTNLLSWIIGSFFDMTTNTKSEASVEQKNEEIASPSSRTSSKSSLSQNTGRGGALVKEKSAALSSIFQWLAPLDTMRVAPSAARLLKDEEGVDDSLMHDLPEQPATQRSSSTTSRITNSVIASAKSIGRVWWVNTWAEMLSDEKDEELLLPGANDVEGGLMEALPLDVDNDDEESEIQKTPAASPITSIALDSKGNKKKSKELNDLFSKSEDEIEVDGVMDGDALFDAAKSENESKIVSEVVSYSDRVTALRPTTTEPGKLIDSTSSITTDVNFASVDLPPTNDVSPYISSGAVSASCFLLRMLCSCSIEPTNSDVVHALSGVQSTNG